MDRAYLDTSAYVKRFARTGEKGSETVGKIFNACRSGKLNIVTSLWTLGEGIAAIDKKQRRGEMSQEDAETSIATLWNETTGLAERELLILVIPTGGLIIASWRCIRLKNVSADDALQLISAMTALSNIFVSADSRLVRAASEMGLESYNIEEDQDSTRLEGKLGRT